MYTQALKIYNNTIIEGGPSRSKFNPIVFELALRVSHGYRGLQSRGRQTDWTVKLKVSSAPRR